jgi:cephalosporin hydroxylase
MLKAVNQYSLTNEVHVFYKLLFFLPILCIYGSEMREIIQRHQINGFHYPGGTDKDTLHSYIEPYTELLTPFRDKKCNVLEIGVWTGGSSLIWHDFLPYSHLEMFDIQDKLAPTVKAALNPHRYNFTMLNAYTPNALEVALKNSPEGYDIIIDDGDHLLISQIFVLKRYTSLLKSGGILIIEDIQNDRDLAQLKKAVPKEMSFEVIDRRSVKGRYDDLMIVVRKP